ncbi:MAG: pyruvate dehydrogenase (acetyl-transferring) E1 component subunit alpha [Verrucomicrobia bacterium]|nr:pyruvate dehydrogenase (acetyl-transferring) E1 component subunit alpha [Verrucomicrobiota bacterium]
MSAPITSKPVKHADAAINKSLSVEKKRALYRDLCRIRRFEQISLKYYNAGKMGGFLHLYIGQEAVAVGCVSLMGENDHIITAYRDHGHALAVGMDMNACMAELFGKRTGCSKGKGGSMHYFAPDKNYWGGHGIVAGQTPLGTGLAFGLKYKGLKGAAMAFLGDGAVNQGSFHESLNLAALFELPIVFIIENNGYSMGTSQKRSSAYPSCLAERAVGYGMAWKQLNGEDLYEVRAGVHDALERARNEHKPMLLEISTYRYQGHSVADANKFKYRTKEEVERYEREHDPVGIFKAHLLRDGTLDEAAATAIDQAAITEAEAAAQFATQSAFPEPAEIFDDVYWEVDQKTESGQTGRHFFND